MISLGIVHDNKVVYTSDLDVRPILELARFSISFAQNLVHGGELVGLIHEPGEGDVKGYKVDDGGISGIVTREHIIFRTIKGKGDDSGLCLCATYPSCEDLKSLGIATMKPRDLEAQASEFMKALSRVVVEMLDLENVPFSTYTQNQVLQFHETMMRVFDDVLHASHVIFTDEFPVMDSIASGSNECQFLFASVMAGSIPLASRFFEDMEGYFTFTVDANENVASILEHLIGAQLSTIISTGRSLASTAMRQVELALQYPGGRAERLFISFHPIQLDYCLVIIAKGNPQTLDLFLGATAETIDSLGLFDKPFSGDVSEFAGLPPFLAGIPRQVSFEDNGLELDDLVEDLDLEVVTGKGKGVLSHAIPEPDVADTDERAKKSYKARKELLKMQRELNRDLSEGKSKNTYRKLKNMVDLAVKTENSILKGYYEEKMRHSASQD